MVVGGVVLKAATIVALLGKCSHKVLLLVTYGMEAGILSKSPLLVVFNI